MLVRKLVLRANRLHSMAVSAETPFQRVHTVGAALIPCPVIIVLGLRPGLRCLGATSCQSSLSASSGPLEDGLGRPSMPACIPSSSGFKIFSLAKSGQGLWAAQKATIRIKGWVLS